jgi:ribonuclease D
MKPTLINNQHSLSQILESIPSAKTISLDTEFLRRDTYYAKLALLQIAIKDEIYIVDTTIVDIKDLWTLIANSKAIKIIHSGRQDLEIMHHFFGILPNNIFDTQIAAGFCGFRAETSYSELCNAICNIEDMDKNLQNCNWLKRPLTPQMISYAGIDVQYLDQIYTHLQRIITEQNNDDIFAEKTDDLLLNMSLYTRVVQNAWKKIKYYKTDEKFINRLKVISIFREESAQALDIPRRYFLTDDQVISICNNPPMNQEKLYLIRDLSSYMLKDGYKSKLLEICSEM